MINNEIYIGSWIASGNPQIAEIMDQSGIFDFLVIDMQHSTITRREMENLLSRITCEKYVRLRKSDDSLYCQAMDAGADGVIIPDCYKPSDVTLDRSYGLYRSRGYGFKKELIKHNIISQIECPLKEDLLRDIFSVSDGYMIGPYDMNRRGGNSDDDNRCLELAKKMGIKRGYHLVFPTEEKLNKLINEGYNFIALGTDCIAIGEWCRKWKF